MEDALQTTQMKLLTEASAGEPRAFAVLTDARGPEGSKRAVPLSRLSENRLGRAEDCEVRLDGTAVSRYHAVIRCEPDGWVVEDRKSKNGTRVNGEAIGNHRLREGDRLVLGDQVVVFSFLGTDTRAQRDEGGPERASAWTLRVSDGSVRWAKGLEEQLKLPLGLLTGFGRLRDALSADVWHEVARQLATVTREGDVVEFESEVVLSSGEVRALAWRGLLKGAGPADFRVVGSVTDVSAARLRVQELKRQAMVFESLHEAVALLDATGRIIDWNKGAARTFGYAKPEVVGRELFAVLKPGSSLDATMLDALEAERTWHATDELRAKAGAAVYAEMTGVPLERSGGEALGFVVILRDVTERKLLQEQLVLSERMAVLGTLASGVAHEINNPLAFIRANIEFLVSEIEAGSVVVNGEVRDVLRESREGVARIARIVNDLRRLSRHDREEQLVPVRLDEAVSSACTMAAHLVRQRGRLVKRFDEIRPVMAVESRLAQVVLNLVVNAAQALPEGHSSMHEITVTIEEQDDEGVLRVSDTGKGITPDVMPRIFDPFFTTKPVGEGTGLGLAICQSIIQSFRGTITVSSEPGRGTTFEVRIPLSEQASAATRRLPAVLTEPPVRQGRVLMIDDERRLGEALRRALRPHDVVVVGDGEEGWAALEEDGASFDLIVCDLSMPRLNGDELFARVQRAAPELAQRFVIMTGGAFSEGAERFLQNCPVPVLKKPVEVAALRDYVARAVSNRPAQPSRRAATER
ncbi:MAG: PAS domain S-box protein [Myxococcaceae bacterium]|nr:PAS domain S-box protein [Myxococcaceae bacterium]MCA3014305.1 PAS domain S-box protein [Myxococcaceae bacterium]